VDRVLVFSADCHGGAPVEQYREYLESRYHEDFDTYLRGRAEYRRALLEQRNRNQEASGGPSEERSIFSEHLDAAGRLKRLEEDGVVGEVIFPEAFEENEVPFSGPFGTADRTHDPDLHAAGQRAYNRWLADFVDPQRQVGLALIASHDVEAAVREIEWAASSSLRGVLFDGVVSDLPLPYNEYHDPIWSACEETGLAVHYHAGAGSKERQTPRGGPTESLIHLHEVQFWAHRSLWYLLYGGILPRHPRLKVVFTEQFADWVPRTITWADWVWHTSMWRSDFRATSPRPPSEYWHEQGWIGASVISRLEVAMREEIGVDHMMFGTDFPHNEGTWGDTVGYLRATFGGVEEPALRAILGENGVAFYGLDRALLSEIAERCGPSIAELAQPIVLESLPANLQNYVTRPINAL
jgi:predicted TIM-barrel fold metal-dependent hydrolase